MEETSNIDNDRYILLTRLVSPGIKDWAKQNQPYIEMLELTKLRWMTTKEQVEIIQNNYEIAIVKTEENQSHQINYGRTDWEIIYSHVIMKKNPNSIAKEYKVSNAHVRLLIKTFKRNLIMKSKWNRRLLNKKKWLNKVHLEFLKEVIWTISSTPYKISNLKSKLEQNFEDLKGISDSTLRRDLRKSLNMRFKKLDVVNPNNITHENFGSMIQSGALLQVLSNYGIEIIFIDEFSINSRSHKIYGWAEKGKKALISKYPGSESFSVIIGLSSKRFYTFTIK